VSGEGQGQLLRPALRNLPDRGLGCVSSPTADSRTRLRDKRSQQPACPTTSYGVMASPLDLTPCSCYFRWAKQTGRPSYVIGGTPGVDH
jgi:hypothetical protein